MSHLRSGLCRSKSDRAIGGVLAGIAHRLGWNANELRSVYVFLTLVSFGIPGVLVYLALWAMMPPASGRPGAAA